jgi:ADP-ribosylglycohydrolase
MMKSANKEAILGSLLGTAVGDALGSFYEGLSRRVAALGEVRHRFYYSVIN